MKLEIKEKFWIGTYIALWLIVSTVSTIHSVEFFKLSNNIFLSWSLSLAFELGAIASLGGLLISRGSKTLIWMLFILLTAFQIHCNMYWSWVNAKDLTEWIHLLDLIDQEPDLQRRIFTIISGGILPIISLGFMKSLMDYLNPNNLNENKEVNNIDSQITKDELDIPEEYYITDNLGNKELNEAFTINDILNEESIKPLEDKVESQQNIQDENKEQIDSQELVNNNDNVIIKEVKYTTPFWFNLNPFKTLSVLSKNNNKLESAYTKK